MGIEIERKFLVDHTLWAELPKPEGKEYRQGYMNDEPGKTIRVRIAGNKGFITIKGATSNNTRDEYEYEIPAGDAEELLEKFTVSQVTKTRYCIIFNQKTWEVDVFHDDNHGLIVAEIELRTADETFEVPSWIGLEVSGDRRYYNSALASNPFTTWKKE
ncbi:MAG: CYTH domain-containing protein [Bacteroidota bacterium]